MADIIIDDVDSVNIKIACEKSIAKELSDFFTFYVPGHKFMPAYRNRMWDGQIKLYNMYKQQLYSGLLDYTIKLKTTQNHAVKQLH